MSEVMNSGTDIIHVRLLDEPVDVWRPVRAVPLGNGHYRLAEQAIPPEEVWEFQPGDEVAIRNCGIGADAYLAATAPGKPRRRAAG